MSTEFVPIPNWPRKQPWRIRKGTYVFLDPDTGRPLDPAKASTEQLDRLWAALHAHEHRWAGTLIGDCARQLRERYVETEDTARRAQRLADPTPPQEIAA